MNGSLDVGIFIQKLHALFQTPHATLQHAEHILQNLVPRLLRFLLKVSYDRSNGFNNCNNQ
jgi:hypothetical protein